MNASTNLVRADTRTESSGRSLAEAGFAVADAKVPASVCEAILRELERVSSLRSIRRRGGVRNLFDLVPGVRDLATSSPLRALVEPVLGRRCFAVGATLFDKTAVANWSVSWHQDLSIAVREPRDLENWGPWSEKDGISYVQPPASILESMLAVRVHLDQCHLVDGCLRVIPGSHRLGRLTADAIVGLRRKRESVECPVPEGGMLMMRPLLLHSSSRSTTPGHRRVVHVEYAAEELPGELNWRQRLEA